VFVQTPLVFERGGICWSALHSRLSIYTPEVLPICLACGVLRTVVCPQGGLRRCVPKIYSGRLLRSWISI